MEFFIDVLLTHLLWTH